MTDAGQNLFRLSPLGHWLDFTHKTRGDPLLIVLFLQQQVQVTNPNPETLYFRIGPHLRLFGRREFMLMTGLPFDILPSVSHRDGNAFVRRLFPCSVLGVPTDQPLRLKISDLLDLYDNMSGLDDEDVVRICSLVMVETVLLGRQRHDDVDDVLLNVVHDLAIWNEFPWGSYIWSFTYKHMDCFLDRRFEEVYKKITLYGFVHPFEVI